ncbi:3-oxoacyl-ACP reductase OS=Streptomyces rimosus subsp. rimosus (strain ATCC / DSM 40260 / JCM 4667 / NRRL 2234) OX=1265868 GN=SRIM_012105 PE=3 SV=1 [Streptomyces rimosus subsp. rimosus]
MSAPTERPLDGLTAIVTGAARGLARAAGGGPRTRAARRGRRPSTTTGSPAATAPARRRRPRPRRPPRRSAPGGEAVAHVGDVADHETARDLVQQAVARWGKLDILVNNAGILRDRMVFSMTEDEWDSVIRVHLKGHFNTTRFAAAHWRERSKAAGAAVYGRIVNTSSEAFLAGSAGQPNYAAAKGGIVGLTTSSALALAKYGVTVNAICPRARTRMTEDVFAGFEVPADGALDPLAPEHVAPLVGYLASPAAARLNGQLLVVHGGMVAVVERPKVAAQFDTAKDAFTYAELDGLLTPYYEERPPNETFAAAEVLGLKRR